MSDEEAKAKYTGVAVALLNQLRTLRYTDNYREPGMPRATLAVADVARTLGVTPRGVQKALARLMADGLVIEPVTWRYRLADPATESTGGCWWRNAAQMIYAIHVANGWISDAGYWRNMVRDADATLSGVATVASRARRALRQQVIDAVARFYDVTGDLDAVALLLSQDPDEDADADPDEDAEPGDLLALASAIQTPDPDGAAEWAEDLAEALSAARHAEPDSATPPMPTPPDAEPAGTLNRASRSPARPVLVHADDLASAVRITRNADGYACMTVDGVRREIVTRRHVTADSAANEATAKGFKVVWGKIL